MNAFGVIVLCFVSALIAAAAGTALSMHLLRKRSRAQSEADRDKGLAEINSALLAAKDENRRIKEAAEHEMSSKLAELEELDAALKTREAALDQRSREIERLECEASETLDGLSERVAEAQRELQRLSEMSPEEARSEVLGKAQRDADEAARNRTRQILSEAEADAERRARQTILNVIQRIAAEYTIEATSAVVQLPSEDMKGRLIGREGRNIRTFEQVTGVDLIIDESPDRVVVSSFDPIRREIARLTLMNLMLDGRIHPARIEELHDKAVDEVDRVVRESGEQAAERANVVGVPAQVLAALGRLRLRTSYAQNVLDHSVEVAELCARFAEELGYRPEIAKRAGLLHDIGKGLGPEWEGPHAVAGMNFLLENGENPSVANAVGAHHHDVSPETPEAQIVIVADSISASRPGARRESLDQYAKRQARLEEIANSFPGVDRSYAMQAGREIRLIVRPDDVDDAGAARLAVEVAKKIKSDLEHPGQIKVTVIRETRVQEIVQ